MSHAVNAAMQDDALLRIVSEDAFVGWVYDLTYDEARVITNDAWKVAAHGIPHNAFLVATALQPDRFAESREEDREVVLLRVLGPAPLPHEDAIVASKINHYQAQKDVYGTGDRAYDDLTKAQIQWSGLACRVLGTFYKRDGALVLGADLESYVGSARLQVYRPRASALAQIVNHVDLRAQAAAAKFNRERLGITQDIPPLRLGTVRYTSTDRLHRADGEDKVPVLVQPVNFLARRTAVFGMTRTGKSNFVKQTVTAVRRVVDAAGIGIGQLIFDINGEYANATRQDNESIADLFADDTVRYRMLPAEGFRELRTNFYTELDEGLALIREVLREERTDGTADARVFATLSLAEPAEKDEHGLMTGDHKRWQVRCAAYRALLHRSGFGASKNARLHFPTSKEVRERVLAVDATCDKKPEDGLTLDEAVAWFAAARTANRQQQLLSTGKGNRPWLDDQTAALLNLLAQRNEGDVFIKGFAILSNAVRLHTPRRSGDVTEEIYRELTEGKIVIVDLSVGAPDLVEQRSKEIAEHVRKRSMQIFTDGKNPVPILVYVEEAHNLLGKDADPTDTWPRLAKEGAKALIGLVYATQEVSALHASILANTENWFVTHLNNEQEVALLAKYYDFGDFRRSLLRAQDVGFARVKTLTSPFVVPMQIDEFKPDAIRAEFQAARAEAQASGATSTAPAIRPVHR